jgi:hypothetical protein
VSTAELWPEIFGDAAVKEVIVAASLGQMMWHIASLWIKMSPHNYLTGLPVPARLTISVLLGLAVRTPTALLSHMFASCEDVPRAGVIESCS